MWAADTIVVSTAASYDDGMRLRRIVGVVLVVFLMTAACGANSDSSGALTRTVFTDARSDDFAASFFGYYPRVIEAHPGDTIDFTQVWSGEPHTVTLGTMTEALGREMAPALKGRRALPDFVDTAAYGLPSIFSETSNDNSINQVAAQPCFVAAQPLPLDAKDCPKKQPTFTGSEAFYNSGYIPYRGLNGNHFEVPLAKTIAPGEYFYYCLLHGPQMGGYIDVKPARVAVKRGKPDLHDRDLVATIAALKQVRARASTAAGRLPGTDIQAGAFTFLLPGTKHVYAASDNEFLPSTFHARVGQKVTWSISDGPGHTVSFKVPSYFPLVRFAADGSVTLNPAGLNAQGGPGYPKTDAEPPPDGVAVDAGNYDGSFFLSSGFPDGPMRYSVTFSKPGTYPYACIIHPQMIGKIVVS